MRIMMMMMMMMLNDDDDDDDNHDDHVDNIFLNLFFLYFLQIYGRH